MKQAILLSVVAAGALLGCGRTGGGVSNTRPSDPGSGDRILRIGYQKGGALNVLRLNGRLEQRLAPLGARVEWLNFPAGPQLLEALGVGSVDLGATGDAPAVFAQAAGNDLVYVANQPPNEEGDDRAILVPKDSPIRTLADLRGKRIAVQKGSGTHNFLVQALEKAGVAYSDIRPVYLAPPDARPAFDSGSVDAWAIWNPFLTIAQKATEARTLANGAGILSAGGFYLSSRAFVHRHPDLIRIALEEVEQAGKWSAENPRAAAELLAPQVGLTVDVLEEMERRTQREGAKYYALRPIAEPTMAAQQAVADNFFRIGLLPKRVSVRKGMLSSEEYAGLTPGEQKGRTP